MTSKFPLIAPDAEPTAQEVFDAAAKWLLEQPEPCVTPEEYDDDGENIGGGYCCYRSPDGQNACGVGAFMPDDLARLVDMAGEQAIGDVMIGFSDRVPHWFEKHSTLLSGLQSVHDNTRAPREQTLAALANSHGLIFRPA